MKTEERGAIHIGWDKIEVYPNEHGITLLNMDCMEYMRGLPDSVIDLTVTSPPYDNLRTYNGNIDQWNESKWKAIIAELYRVTKQGGVVVWVVGDATIKGSESGTSFKQALWAMECGFNLHDTMIYQKNSYPFPPSNRYYQQFEYMFVWSKDAPKTFNGIKQKTIWKKKTDEVSTTRKADGSTVKMKYAKGKDERLKDNIWVINTGYMRSTKDKEAYKHSAIFPESLAHDHIISWSNHDDTVFDPFTGSGTTGKMAVLLERKFIGTEMDSNYFDIACARISEAMKETAQKAMQL